MLDFRLFLEKVYNINLDTRQTNYTFITKKGRMNRLQHLVYQIEQTGSPFQGEKISEILLGAVNLNVLDLSYPFVDLKVIYPIKDVTEYNELISIKTSRDTNNLKDAVTYVNGFKIKQLIQFAITKINLKIFKSETFKERFAIKLSSITSYYQKLIIGLFKDNSDIYSYAFINQIVIFNFIKEYLKNLQQREHIIEKNRNRLYSIISACTASFIDRKFGTNYVDSISAPEDIKISVANYINKNLNKYDFSSDFINYGDALPEEIKNLKISFCILYFNESKKEEENILNLQKTHAITFGELFDKSMKIWIRKGYHNPDKIKKNVYLNYNDVVSAFSNDNLQGDDVFNTHIQVQINLQYKERSEEVKKLYVKVIDNIKGIENDESQTKILKLLNKYLNKINSPSKETRDKYIQKFSNMFDEEN